MYIYVQTHIYIYACKGWEKTFLGEEKNGMEKKIG